LWFQGFLWNGPRLWFHGVWAWHGHDGIPAFTPISLWRFQFVRGRDGYYQVLEAAYIKMGIIAATV
jgi:hypothetical protein